MLTTIEYHEVQTRKAVLQGEIDGAARDKVKFDGMKQAAQTRKEHAEGAMLLYTNHLSDAVEEYEAAHPPEDPEGPGD